jgi:FAD/FMN-containing dehydrogenase
VLGLTVAFADGMVKSFQKGERIDFDVPAIPLPRTTKNTAGYPLRPGMDWIDLICGSEGTLGVVCEAELQLLPTPGELITGVVFFADDGAAVAAVDAWRRVPGLRMLEYMDAGSLDLMRPRFDEIPRGARAAVLMEEEGEDVDAWVERTGDLDSWFAATDQDRERFRRFRHALPEMVNDTVRREGFMKLGSDYAVPLERNLEMLEAYRDRLAEFRYVIFGHIGDAHVHANILPRSGGEFERGKTAMLDLARAAVGMGGTVSAEHGLGKRKAHLLALQYAPEHIEAMKAVKRRLDPAWILGRGNLFAEA